MLMALKLPQIIALLLVLMPAGAFAQAKVVTSIKPLQLIAAAITDGVSTPQVLIPANQSPHHFSLRPSDVRRIEQADVLIWVGPGLETYLSRVIMQSARNSQIIEAAKLETMHLLDLQEEDSAHEHEHEGHYDPHLWLNTGNAQLIAEALVIELEKLDSGNASRYRGNLVSFQKQMQALEAQLQERFAALKSSQYAVYHNGTHYFEEQFGLAHLFVLVPDHEQQPGIRHLLAVREQVQALQPSCLLTDINANDATINTVFQDFTVRQAKLDTLGDGLAVTRDAYQQLIESLAQTIQDCLSPR